jgi:hypothetical protein
VAGGQSSYFVWLNRGKESVTIDLAEAAGKTRLSELISTADVLVQNLKHGPAPIVDGQDRRYGAVPAPEILFDSSALPPHFPAGGLSLLLRHLC